MIFPPCDAMIFIKLNEEAEFDDCDFIPDLVPFSERTLESFDEEANDSMDR